MGRKVIDDRQLLESAGKSRRKFVKKVIAGTAFAAPLIASFPMNGLRAESARSLAIGNQTCTDCSRFSGLERIFCEIEDFLLHLFGKC